VAYAVDRPGATRRRSVRLSARCSGPERARALTRTRTRPEPRARPIAPRGDCPVIYRGPRGPVMLPSSSAMNVQILIDSIVRQVTVLIAQLATSGGVRAPLAHIANQVFVDLASELEAQGVSRKVSADMFGMALRAYIRKVRRLSEGRTERGKMLWQAVLELIKKEELVTKERVLERFKLDGELEVSAILHDLSESGLVFCSGSGSGAVYRAATDAELGRLSQLSGDRGL